MPTCSENLGHTLVVSPYCKVEYGQLWNEIIEQSQFEVITTDLVIGPQGLAAVVLLKDDLNDWHHMLGAFPHIYLMVAEGFESKALGHGSITSSGLGTS